MDGSVVSLVFSSSGASARRQAIKRHMLEGSSRRSDPSLSFVPFLADGEKPFCLESLLYPPIPHSGVAQPPHTKRREPNHSNAVNSCKRALCLCFSTYLYTLSARSARPRQYASRHYHHIFNPWTTPPGSCRLSSSVIHGVWNVPIMGIGTPNALHR